MESYPENSKNCLSAELGRANSQNCTCFQAWPWCVCLWPVVSMGLVWTALLLMCGDLVEQAGEMGAVGHASAASPVGRAGASGTLVLRVMSLALLLVTSETWDQN